MNSRKATPLHHEYLSDSVGCNILADGWKSLVEIYSAASSK